MTAQLTADNVYALYAGTPSSLSLIGSDAAWGVAETYNFALGPAQYVFVAAWDAPTPDPQGFQGRFTVAGGSVIRTNTVDWVYTAVSPSALGTWTNASSVPPSTALLQTALSSASWLPVLASAPNNGGPWGSVVPDAGALWIWPDTLAANSSTDGRLVVFRTAALVSAVPEPQVGLTLLAGLALVCFIAARRRRSRGSLAA